MKFSEILIIYLAAGAPFAVYSLLHRNDTNKVVSLTVFLLNLVIWPWTAFRLSLRFTQLIPTESLFETRDVVDAKIIELEEKYQRETLILSRRFLEPPQRVVFEEAMDRYMGLSAILSADNRIKSEEAFFSITNHPNKKIAATCLNRRNRNRVYEHRTRAAHDLHVFINAAALSDKIRSTLIDKVSEVSSMYEELESVQVEKDGSSCGTKGWDLEHRSGEALWLK